jgi:hypothetical protein
VGKVEGEDAFATRRMLKPLRMAQGAVEVGRCWLRPCRRFSEDEPLMGLMLEDWFWELRHMPVGANMCVATK